MQIWNTYCFRIPKKMLDPLVGYSMQLMTKRVPKKTPMGMLAADFLQLLLKQPDATFASGARPVNLNLKNIPTKLQRIG